MMSAALLTTTTEKSSSVVVAKKKPSVSLVQSIRRTELYKEWKKAVFLRDRFACQQCGRRNGRKRVIEAHHLRELSLLVRENNITSIEAAKACPRLWEVSNGQTLCKTCHQQTDSYPKQFRNGKTNKPKPANRTTTTKRLPKRHNTAESYRTILFEQKGNSTGT